MLRLNAAARFVSVEDGGHRISSGLQPGMQIGTDLVACKIVHGPPGTNVEANVWHDLVLELAYGEELRDKIFVGMKFNLAFGGWVIGEGEVTDLPPIDDRQI